MRSASSASRARSRGGDAGAFEPPPGIDPAAYLRDDPLAYGDAPAASGHGAGRREPRASGWSTSSATTPVVERHEDGSVVVELEVVNRDAFRTWVLDLLEHAEVLSPPDLRDEFVAWLDAVVAAERAGAR